MCHGFEEVILYYNKTTSVFIKVLLIYWPLVADKIEVILTARIRLWSSGAPYWYIIINTVWFCFIKCHLCLFLFYNCEVVPVWIIYNNSWFINNIYTKMSTLSYVLFVIMHVNACKVFTKQIFYALVVFISHITKVSSEEGLMQRLKGEEKTQRGEGNW